MTFCSHENHISVNADDVEWWCPDCGSYFDLETVRRPRMFDRALARGAEVGGEQKPSVRVCSCLGTCKGKDGLAPGWSCALELGTGTAQAAEVATCDACGLPISDPAHRGWGPCGTPAPATVAPPSTKRPIDRLAHRVCLSAAVDTGDAIYDAAATEIDRLRGRIGELESAAKTSEPLAEIGRAAVEWQHPTPGQPNHARERLESLVKLYLAQPKPAPPGEAAKETR